MANHYVLAYHDESNKLRLCPEKLHVQHEDTVIWASNVNEQYIAGGFSNPDLFPKDSYGMPPNTQSSPAPVQNVPVATYQYTCTGTGSTGAAADGDSAPGIIIVDPPGGGNHGNGKRHNHQPESAKKKSR